MNDELKKLITKKPEKKKKGGETIPMTLGVRG